MIVLPETPSSLWLQGDHTTYPQLAETLHVDVVIIGAGIAGLTSAYLLMKSGLKIAVVEKDTIAAGVTGHTTGKVTSQHSLIYAQLASRLGSKTAGIYGTANQQALEEITHIIKREHIDCDWSVDTNYVFTTNPDRVAEFREEARVADSLGLPASFTTKTDLPFPVTGAVSFAKQGKLNSRKYLMGLAAAITSGGGKIYENSHVVVIREGEPAKIRTSGGTVFAKDVIVATNVPTFPLAARVSYALGEYPMQSYIVAGKASRPLKGMYISPDPDNYSILPITVGSDEYMLIGGESNIPGTRFNFKTRHERLAAYGEKYFDMQTIAHRWYHRDYLGYDDMPLVGPLYSGSKHLYTATGFMKWGLTNGTMAAMILCDLVNGIPNAWASTFNPHRSSLIGSIPKVIGEKLSG